MAGHRLIDAALTALARRLPADGSTNSPTA
jgi:hypothetical protein